MQLLFAATTDDGWRSGIGDPTFMGWLTVAAYFIVAGLCWRAYRVDKPPSMFQPRSITRIWLGLGLLFIALGINKQLDLQSLFTQIGRSIARQEGWYGNRREVQSIFIATLALGGALAIVWLFWMTRNALRTYGLALVGALFTVTFIIIRAASFHRIDEMLGWSYLGVEMNWVLELSGIACVGAGAAMTIRRHAFERQQRRQMRAAYERWDHAIRGNSHRATSLAAGPAHELRRQQSS